MSTAAAGAQPAPVEVVNAADPRAAELLAQGYRVIAESWGARLEGSLDDIGLVQRLTGAVERASVRGWWVGQVPATAAAEVAAVEEACLEDFPQTPATVTAARGPETIAALMQNGMRVFGARLAGPEGALVAVTGVSVVAHRGEPARAETDRTCVLAEHRRQGLAVAIKAASVLALLEAGHTRFGTGGAAVNRGSLAMNSALGYRITERWLSLKPPR